MADFLHLGPVTSPGGGAGEAAAQTITATRQVVGPLPAGRYTVEGDVAFWALTGSAALIGTPSVPVVSAGDLAAKGVNCPASKEIFFEVGPGVTYFAWVRQSGDGVSLRINRRDKGLS